MTKGEAVSDHVTKGYRDRLDEGRRAMAHLIFLLVLLLMTTATFMSPTTVGFNRKETPNTGWIQNSLLMMADYARPSCSDIQAKLNRK